MNNKIDKIQYNDKDQQHGYWECYYNGDILMFKCFYNNGKEVGYEENYSYLSKLTKKKYYL
jgi:hypothetical protein